MSIVKIALVNLMPQKHVTDSQVLSRLREAGIDFELHFVRPAGHTSRSTDPDYLEHNYITLPEIPNLSPDIIIITGAPVETLPFEDVAYWGELLELWEWSARTSTVTVSICWAAQARIYAEYGVPKRDLSTKLSGVFPTIAIKNHPLAIAVQGVMPQSRFTTTNYQDLEGAGLHILATGADGDPYLWTDVTEIHFYISGHLEYDASTLPAQHARDSLAGIAVNAPVGVSLNGESKPERTWIHSSNRFFQALVHQVLTT